MDAEFISATLSKIQNFAIKNDFKKLIVKYLPKKTRLSEQWKIELYKNYISFSDLKPLDVMLESESFAEREKELINSIKEGFIAPFEILDKKDCLQVYNFVNEKEYLVCPVKQEAFKNNELKYFVSMMIEFEDNLYIMDVVENFKSRRAAYLVTKEILLEDSTLLYRDNPEKEKEVKRLVNKIYSEFIDLFGSDAFLIEFDMAITFTDLFLEFIEIGNEEVKETLVSIFKNRNNLENSGEAKNSESENDLEDIEDERDEKSPVLVFVVKDKGIYIANDYSVLEKIYATGDINFIYENTDILNNYFFEDFLDHPSEAILYLYEKSEDKEKFLEITREIINEVSEDYEFDSIPDIKSLNVYELLDFFKENYDSELTTYSLYTLKLISNSINELFEETEAAVAELADLFEKQKEKTCLKGEDFEIPEKIGRNDPCYCGSGKKYKKCCME